MSNRYTASVTYALALYRAGVEDLGVRNAYHRACVVARLTRPERADLRHAVDTEAEKENVK